MDEYLLKARLDDIIRASGKTTKYLGFLDPAEYIYISNMIKNRKDIDFNFWGGHSEAERVFLSIGDLSEINEYFPITAINIKFREEDKLSHRDFLGSFMGSGVTRSSIGDILVEDGRAVVFVKSDLAQYFVNSITKIGKVGIKCSENPEYPLPQMHRTVDLNGVVASTRLDCVIALLAKTSREKACTLISSGLVNVNYVEVTSNSYKVNEKDKISIRGKGKFMIETINTPTKKGRLPINCKKYV